MNALAPDTARHQRSHGAAHVAMARLAGRTRLSRLAQRGSARAILLDSADRPEVVFLNTSGGLTGGDRLELSLDLGAGCQAVATTQTAERAYRAAEGEARVRIQHAVHAGAHLDWLPQETILYESSALSRRSEIALHADASCLVLEAVVLGRAAMGEHPRELRFGDHRTITRDGRPVLIEPLLLDRDAIAGGPAVLGGARAFAILALVQAGAEDAVAAARDALGEPGVSGAASGFDGKLVVRLMAGDGWPLKRQIVRLLRRLRPLPLPRVWQMAGGTA
ncbi:urease accessory protein UreD [Pararhodobacter sp. SW119]|uniref:urease accessory protein UreD n=1 Tax=Pararhodobacter sp. SW119 TaxID=2780075 RepID=UPI001AE0E3BC|nr:urease accessory protein UreD [Pararhodobacter sp. SW119]